MTSNATRGRSAQPFAALADRPVLAAVLGALSIAFSAVLERPSNRVLAAMPIVVLGVVLISGVIGSGAYGSHPTLGVITGVVTGVSYAGFLLALRRGNADLRRPAGPLFDATWVAAIAAVVMG